MGGMGDGMGDGMGGGGDHGGPRKPLMCRGREIRTVEDAAALDCILELAHDQNGCRFLQDQLDLRAKLHIDLIFEAVLSAVVHLAMDPFGNYLIQKLLQYGVTAQRTRLVRAAAPNIIEIALNVHGTRAVQKMVEVADADEQADAIVGAIEQRAMELVQDMNGNHVVQRVLAVMGPQRSAFVYDLAQRECLAVSMHRHGCCVMQRCLDHANSATRNAIIEQVVHHARKLVCDPFGNYVVQYVLDLKQLPLTLHVIQSLHGNMAELSLQKFSSNVIEKCLTCGDREIIGLIASELQSSSSLVTLLHDPYANYVIQTLLTVGSDDEVRMLLAKIQPHMASLRSTLYGKRIQAKLARRFPQLRTAVG